MHEPNVSRLLELLKPTDQVLDVGGWACPFNRAQWVLDSEPFETRGFYRTFGSVASQGGDQEWFSKDTWIQRDICDKTPWPFADKQFDFVICSHTLEDLRDPIWVCSELARVGKRGYIEVPSRAFESCLGVERPGQAGLSHHRWLVEIRDNEILFVQKYHLIHSHWRFALPASYQRVLTSETSVQWLWWEDGFKYRELFHHGVAELERELEQFVEATYPYPEVADRPQQALAVHVDPPEAGGFMGEAKAPRRPALMNNSHTFKNDETFTGLVREEEEYFRWQSEKVKLIASILRGLKPKGVLADVGCFTGLATAIYRSAGFERAVGFDASREALAVAGGRGIESRVWRIGEESCPAAESEFDIIVAADIIEHLVDTDTFLRELRRALRPDGVLIITTPNLAFWMSRLRLLTGKTPWSYPGASSTVRADLMIDLNHIRITTRREWECLFRAQSFEIGELHGWSILHASGNGMGVRIRRVIDRYLTAFPDLAFGLLFVLRKTDQK